MQMHVLRITYTLQGSDSAAIIEKDPVFVFCVYVNFGDSL
jgi:hypothetical protein